MFSASGSQTWTADVDYTFVGAASTVSTANQAVISTDPGQTAAEAVTPTTTRISYDLLWANNTAGQAKNIPVKVPVPQGTKIIVATAQATNIMAYFDEVVS